MSETNLPATPPQRNPTMTARERSDLAAHCRRVERVAKTAAKARGAELMADCEAQLARKFHYDEREVWAAAKRKAEDAVAAAQARIAEECEKLGIPRGFAPGLSMGWYDRGENAVKQRRDELRRVAQTRVDANVRAAIERIEAEGVRIQQKLLVDGLTSDAAHAFLSGMPTAEQLLPTVSLDELEASGFARLT